MNALRMFPVYTGINRVMTYIPFSDVNVPCIHRDKPYMMPMNSLALSMFPVYTGINRPR